MLKDPTPLRATPTNVYSSPVYGEGSLSLKKRSCGVGPSSSLMSSSSSLSFHGFCKSLGPRLERARLVAVQVPAGHHDDRDHGEVGVSLQPLQDDKPVTGWQTKIQNDQIRLMLTSLAYRGHRIDGEEGIVVVGLEKNVIPETDIGVVLNDKNLFVSHGRQPQGWYEI